ncbi:MAG: hypothetical protein GFH27_549283n9 [Chloroflexi bacterium AL-W]|nr:hypothetical protein [Chloroflexi bacterium AL-N1]NOK64871.1 hypothetical protein [Chloroflexi bacterium AL-N10]NOK76641.1 hypothetical protein [Chloroflexi bacterium AL-N5]NOK80130.1 hypothetical protein [Chloroflexi bacterium AL-W]NOK86643.1 hypothetical protein [Chloroflexi bacterium AL-N15]
MIQNIDPKGLDANAQIVGVNEVFDETLKVATKINKIPQNKVALALQDGQQCNRKGLDMYDRLKQML